MMSMQADPVWLFPQQVDPGTLQALVRETGLPISLAELLIRRGLAGQAGDFLDPKLRSLSDPFLLPEMQAAVDRIFRAIDAREKIALFGDYDVDGVTSLALLQKVLRAYGAEVAAFLPHRIDEGYGLSADGVARCLQEHQPRLLIAVDCGTSSAREIASVQNSGIDVIVLDHHECPAELPKCVALVNPKRGETYRYLCSVGVAFKVAHAMGKVRRLENLDLRELLDLVALGTVADIVPLVDENRIFVKTGSERLAKSKSAGIRALMDVSGVELPVRCEDIGFRLGPRLNAAGRLDSAVKAFHLLTTEDSSEARTLARELDLRNRERQEIEKRTLAEAEKQLLEYFDPQNHAAIVVGALGWHPGVLGIVASRLCKKFYRPTLVLGFDESGNGKGSGRSVDGISLVRALTECATHLEKFGGHEMAAGLSMQYTGLGAFREAMNAVIRATATEEQLRPTLRLDGEVYLSDLNFRFLEQHERLQPFGAGQHQPLFCARGVQLEGEPRVMKEKHLRLRLKQRGSYREAVYFSGAERELPRPPWDVAFKLEPNVYQGEIRIQLQIAAVRSSGAA